jgi:pimeloyl-ACP methyl ester carboxylesterase
MSRPDVQYTHLGEREVSFIVQGVGEAVLLIHGALSEAYQPLFDRPELGGYQLIAYDRPGFGNSSRPAAPVPIAEEAANARALLRHLGVEHAHVVGHSYGGAVALQLALDFPESVTSLALLEPAIPSVLLTSPDMGAAIGTAVSRYQEGDHATALDNFLAAACGPTYRARFESALPQGAFERAVASVDTIFQCDLTALPNWTFGSAEARGLQAPMLLVVGAETLPLLHAIDAQLRQWLPQAEHFVLPASTHLLMLENALGMAQVLAAFFAQHSSGESPSTFPSATAIDRQR